MRTEQNQPIPENQTPDPNLQEQKFVDEPYTEDNWFHTPKDGDAEPVADPNAEPKPNDPQNLDPNQQQVDPNQQPDPSQQLPVQQDPNQPVKTESQRALEQANQYQPLVDLYQQDQAFQQHVESYVNRNDPRSIPQQPLQPMNPHGLPQQPNPYDVARQQLGYNQQYPVNPYAPMQYPNQYGDPQVPMQPQMPIQPNPQNVAQQMNLPKPPAEFEPYQMTDQSTPSGKWFTGVMNEFGQQIGNNFATQMQQQQNQYAMQIEELRLGQIQRDAEETQFNQFLASRPDLDMRTARQFWDWASNPNNVTVDSLYNVYQQQNQQQPQNQNLNQQQLQNPQQPNVNVLDATLEKIRQNQNFPQTSVNVNQPQNDEPEGTKFLKGLDNHFF